jgi:P4 family phage/plasmid primase-like protien
MSVADPVDEIPEPPELEAPAPSEPVPEEPLVVPPVTGALWSWAKGYIRRYGWTLAPIWLTETVVETGTGETREVCACPEKAMCAAPGKHLVAGLGVARTEVDVEDVWSAKDARVSGGLVGIAVMAGEESNLLVVDVRTGGAEITRARYKIIEEVLTATTPSGGQHWFFALEPGETVTGGRREIELVTGVWLLGDEAYVALAPRAGYDWVGGAEVLRHRDPGAVPDMLRHRLVSEGLLSTVGGGPARGGSDHRDDPWRTAPGVPLAGGAVMPRTFTKTGDIRRVIDEWGHLVTWTPGFGWRVWTEGGWAGTDRSEMTLKARISDLPKLHLREAGEAHARGADDLAKEATKWAQRSLGRATAGILADLVTDERVLVPRADMWDAEGWIVGLPVRDGVGRVIDLRTGEVFADARQRRVSKRLGVEWRGKAEGEAAWARSVWFRKYLRDLVDQHGEDWVRLLQRAMGASLYGRNGIEGDLDAFFVLKGPARSGKSTAQIVLSTIMGMYGGPGNENLLFGDRGNPEFVIAAVLGKRALFFDEPPLHSPLNTTRLKALSGGDAFTGRAPYGREEITFEPEVSLWMMTNHALEISDEAVWRRMKVFQFEKSLAASGAGAADPRMRKALAEDPLERTAELHWVLQGARDWFNAGWGSTKVWDEAVDEEKAAHDPISRWVMESVKVTGAVTDVVTVDEAVISFNSWLVYSGADKPKLTVAALRDEITYKMKSLAMTYDKSTRSFHGIVAD